MLDAGAAILANGAAAYGGDPTAAGGSVWITAATLLAQVDRSARRRVREGILLQRRERRRWGDRDRARGALRGHFQLDPGIGGGKGRDGGAGTIYLKGPDSTFGDLLVDNDWIDGRWTILPTLGTGVVDEIDGVVRLVSEQPDDIHGFFVGHWVQVAGRRRASTGRVAGRDGGRQPADSPAQGGLERGRHVARCVPIRYGDGHGRAKLRLYDLDDFGEVIVHFSSEYAPINEGGPTVAWPEAVVLEIFDRKYTIHGLAGAIDDPSGVDRAEIRNTNSLESWELSLGDDGSFEPVEVTGDPTTSS